MIFFEKNFINPNSIVLQAGIFCAALFFSTTIAQAQNIELTTGHSPSSLAETITGNGVTILNPVVNCADGAIGKYVMSDIPNFSGQEGVILSTGSIHDAKGPNNSQSTTTVWNRPGDPTIKAITGYPNFDACVLEFDVVPVGDTLKFDFIFASEEYHEYVGTPFNDVFGFFISGPGIVGDPGLEGLENIALIPGTNQYVGINTVNKGNPDTGFPPTNQQYFVDNPPGYNTFLQYDGWTNGLYAKKVVQPCDTFHLKLVIADVADHKWDSSVFIEKIESNNITVSGTTVTGIDQMIEGCNEGTITFTRDPVTNEDLVVTFYLGGTAENGVDYPLIGSDPDPSVPKFITIPANEASASISILPFDDGIDEGVETIKVYVGNPFCSPAIQDSITLFILDSLPVAIEPPLAYVCMGSSLQLEAISSGTDFVWSPADYLNDPTLQKPTTTPEEDITYSVTATLGECSSTTTVDVFVSDMQITASPTHILCGGENNGAINLNISNGFSPYAVQWSGPSGFTSTNQNISNLIPGTYIAHVTDREGCTQNITVEILETPAMNIALTSPTFVGGHNLSCAESQNAQITAHVEFGTPPYTYAWNDANNQTSQTATNLKVGTYTVTVTDANNCTATQSITLTAPQPVMGTTVDKQNVLCHGMSTATATVEGEGGTAPYTYSWNTTPPQTGNTAVNLSAGTYNVTVTDVNGCIGNIEVEIQEPSASISGVINTTNILCFGEATGSASANIAGGTQPYTYAWSSNPSLNAPTIDNLEAGSYTLTVTDANGCSHTIAFNITQPPQLDVQTVAITNVSCHGDNTGSITVSAQGGKGPYTYSWNTNPPQTENTAQHLTAGSYIITVTDDNGCTAQKEIDITEPEELELDVTNIKNPSCYASANGEIEINATGGVHPYVYTWNTTPPTIDNQIDNLPAGNYEVTVEDANGCTQTEVIELIAPDEITIQIEEIQHVLCYGQETGSITVSVAGGTPDYTYQWNDPLNQTTSTATQLAAGTYTVIVTDENGCQASISATVNEPTNPLQATIQNTEDVLCYGVNNGWATVTATGGSGSYSYSWNDDNNQQTPTATNLAPGTYTVTISDNNGCETPITIDVVINGPSNPITLNISTSTYTGGANVVCAQDSTATIDLTISGGTAPYTVLWEMPDGTTSGDQNLIDLPPGDYTVIVTDQNGCEESQTVQITAPQPIVIHAQTTSSLCFGSPSGSIDLTIEGGVPEYDIEWNGPNGFTSTEYSLIDIEGGIYYITITDANGCVHHDAVTVTQPEDLVITVDSLSEFNGYNLSCYNSADGEIYITPSGGTQPYWIQWNMPGNPGFSNQEDLINLKAGTYEAVLIDDNGCVQNAFIDIVGPDTINIDFDISLYPNGFNISCADANDGTIEAITTGGGVGNFSFHWVGPAGYGPVTGNPIENLGPGTYSVLAIDENGCMAMNAVKLTAPNPFSIEVEATEINGYHISCEGAANGAINLIVKGGRHPVTVQTIEWTGPNGFTSSDSNISNLEPGQYCVTVTDINDCQMTECITLIEPLTLSVDLTSTTLPNGFELSCENAHDGEISANITGGAAPYSISWTGPNNFSSNGINIQNLQAGTYCMNVTDANGCTVNQCITLTQPEPIEITAQNIVQPECGMATTGSIEINVTGGNSGYTYLWTGPNGFTSTDPDIFNLSGGTYCVEVSDINLCTAQKCFTITAPSEIDIVLSAMTYAGGVHISCHDANNGSITSSVEGGEAPYTYQWSGPAGFTSTNKNLENLGPGQYCLQITDAANCVSQKCIEITEPTVLTLNSDVTLPVCGDGSPASIDLSVSGGTTPYTFNWNNGSTSSSVNVGNGNYQVIITDANQCSITESFNISLPDPIQAVPTPAIAPGGFNLSCFESNDGEISLNIYGGTGNILVQWSGPNGYTSTDPDINALQAGEYCVTIVDENGCTDQACVTLTQPDVLSFQSEITNATCTGTADGAATIQISGGIPTYQINWSGPNGYTANGATITGLEAGQYCFVAQDYNGCIISDCIQIGEPTDIEIQLFSNTAANGYNIECYGTSTGNITAQISGGTGSYIFEWHGPEGYTSSDEEINNLFAGTYCLTITDENNCLKQECITLTQPDPAIVNFTAVEYANGFHTTCYSSCDGELEAEITGGAQPIDATWTGPNGFTSNALQISGLCAGTYTLQLTDANGCIQEAGFSITQPPNITIDLSSPTFGGGNHIACYNDSSGVIQTEINGGFGTLIVEWTGPNGFSSTAESLENLSAGTYEITVTDESNCSAQASITLTQPQEELIATATAFEFNSGTNISCKGANDGSITGNASGGVGPYNYHWNGPDGFESELSQISNLTPGAYTLVVEDQNSCVYTVNLNLTEPNDSLFAEAEIQNEILCAHDETGSIKVTATGGSGNYNISWSGPDNFTSTDMFIEHLGAGSYVYTLEDENGCSFSEMIVLEEPEPLEVSSQVIDADCQTSTGIINLTVTNGTAPYNFLWNTGSNGQSLLNVPPGVYSVTITDDNNCEWIESFEIGSTNTLEVEATITDLNCFEDESGMIAMTIISGEEPIQYSWTGPDGFTAEGEAIFDLKAGSYTVVAVDAKGCEIEDVFEVKQPEKLEIEPLESPVFSNGLNLSNFQSGDGIIYAPVVKGGTKPFIYNWSADNGYTSNSGNNQLNLMAGDYILIVKDAHSCSDTAFITLTEPIPLEIPNGISPNGDGFNDYFIVRGLDNYPVNRLLVFNRWGNKVYEEKNYKNSDPWYGTNTHGDELPDGTYYVVVELQGADALKGYLEIRR